MLKLSNEQKSQLYSVVRDNWNGDGQSTQVWNWIIERTGGSLISFDINPGAVAYAKSVAPLAHYAERQGRRITAPTNTTTGR